MNKEKYDSHHCSITNKSILLVGETDLQLYTFIFASYNIE